LVPHLRKRCRMLVPASRLLLYEDAVYRPKEPSGMETLNYRWTILGVAFGSQVAATLAMSVVPPIAPIVQADLGLTKAEIGLFTSASLAGTWGVLLLAGYWTERFGVRKLMSLGLIVSGCVMLTMALAGSFIQAMFVMFAVGLGRGLVEPGATKAIVDWFPARGIATAMGLKQTGYPLGAMLMAAILPALALALGWRSAIALMGLLVLAGGFATALLYRDPPREGSAVRRGISLRGSLGFLLRNRRLWVVSATALLLVVTQFGLVSYLALYFSDVVLPATLPDPGTRLVVAGGFLALVQAGGIAGRMLWGVASDRFLLGRRMPVIAATGVFAALIALVLGYLGPGLPLWLLGIIVFAYGVTALGWNGLYMASAAEAAGRRLSAMGVGFSMTLVHLGVVGGPPLFGFIVDLTGSYQPAWLSLSLFSLAGAVLATISGDGKHATAGR
jgi:MFS transporter, ACS family, hexuronate transporter